MSYCTDHIYYLYMCDNYKACISLNVFILKTCCFNHIYGFENYLSNHKYILSYSNLYLLGPYFYLFLDIVLMYLYRCLSHIMIVNMYLFVCYRDFYWIKIHPQHLSVFSSIPPPAMLTRVTNTIYYEL